MDVFVVFENSEHYATCFFKSLDGIEEYIPTFLYLDGPIEVHGYCGTLLGEIDRETHSLKVVRDYFKTNLAFNRVCIKFKEKLTDGSITDSEIHIQKVPLSEYCREKKSA